MKNFIRISAVCIGGLAMMSGFSVQEANAATYNSCSSLTYNEDQGNYVNANTYANCAANATQNQSSSVATSAAVLKTASTQAAALVAGRVAGALGGGSGSFNISANSFEASSGLSAGGLNGKAGVWASGSWSDVEDENTNTAFDGNVYTVMGGFDYQVTPKAVLGLSVGYEDVDIDTQYNGFGGQDGSLQGDGYTIAPYLGVRLSDVATADLTVGYSDLSYDTVRFDPITGNRITGSTDADRYFVNAAVNGEHRFNRNENWRLRGRAALFYASEDKDGFTEAEVGGNTIVQNSTENDLGQFLLDGRLGYTFQQVEPYALVGLEYDFTKDQGPVAAGQTQSMDSDFGAKLGGGLNLRLGPNVTGGVEAYTVEFRDDYKEYTVTGGLRVQF